MTLLDVILEQHARSHAAALTGAWEPMAEDQLVAGLSADQLRQRPAAGLNSIIWLLWHLARSEDIAVNVLFCRGQQVIEQGRWPRRLKVPSSVMGTGMGDAEVTAVGNSLDVWAVRSYRLAVGQRTREVISGLKDVDLDEPIDPTRLLAVGAFSDPAEGERRVANYWRGRTKGFVLATSVCSHGYLHLGEANTIKTLLHGQTA